MSFAMTEDMKVNEAVEGCPCSQVTDPQERLLTSGMRNITVTYPKHLIRLAKQLASAHF